MAMSEQRKAYMRQYQREYLARRRKQWLDENGPCEMCGTWEDLEIDHRDASEKRFRVGALWSLSPNNPKRIEELAKCRALCRECHKIKTRVSGEHARGEKSGVLKWKEHQVLEMRQLRVGGMTYAAIALRFNTKKQAVWEVCNITWKFLDNRVSIHGGPLRSPGYWRPHA